MERNALEAAARHMKTRLIEIGKDLEPESRDLGINRLGEGSFQLRWISIDTQTKGQ